MSVGNSNFPNIQLHCATLWVFRRCKVRNSVNRCHWGGMISNMKIGCRYFGVGLSVSLHNIAQCSSWRSSVSTALFSSPSPPPPFYYCASKITHPHRSLHPSCEYYLACVQRIWLLNSDFRKTFAWSLILFFLNSLLSLTFQTHILSTWLCVCVRTNYEIFKIRRIIIYILNNNSTRKLCVDIVTA